MSIEIADGMLSRAEAERLSTRISLRLDTASDNWNGALELIREAIAGNAFIVLGYRSHGDYVADRFGGSLSKLGIELRREVVRELSDAGLSQRAIAPVFGVSQSTVRDDVSSTYSPDSSVSTSPEAVEPVTSPVENANTGATVSPAEEVTAPVEKHTPDAVTINPATGEVIDTPVVTEHTITEKTRTVVGLDGKNYTSTPSKPKRRSLVDDAYKANTELWKAIERVRTIRADDRFTRNKADILAALQPSVDLALEILTDL